MTGISSSENAEAMVLGGSLPQDEGALNHPEALESGTRATKKPLAGGQRLGRGVLKLVYLSASAPEATATPASSGGRKALKRFLSIAFM